MEKLNPRTSGSPPLPSVLICAAQLVGTLFVQDARSKILEEQIFARVTQHLSVPSTQTDPANVVFLLQAEALIAFYHFYKNQVVQGYARATAAATQTFVWGLNTSQRARGAPAAGVLGRYHLPPPIDAIEAGERVNAFWTVFWMERCWSVAQGIQSMMFTQDNLTSVPWPLNMSDYEEVCQYLNVVRSRLISIFS